MLEMESIGLRDVEGFEQYINFIEWLMLEAWPEETRGNRR